MRGDLAPGRPRRSPSPPCVDGRRVDGASASRAGGRRRRSRAAARSTSTAPRAFTLTARAIALQSRALRRDARRRSSTARWPRAARCRRRSTVNADVAIAKGSRFAGLRRRGHGARRRHADDGATAAVDLALGASTIALKGSYGTPADTLAYDVDVPRLAELRPLAVRYAKLAAARSARRIAARARHRVRRPGEPGRDRRCARRRRSQWGQRGRRWPRSTRQRSIATGRGPAGPIALSARPIKLDVTATRIVLAQGTLATAKAAVDGTLAQHQATLAATSDGLRPVDVG